MLNNDYGDIKDGSIADKQKVDDMITTLIGLSNDMKSLLPKIESIERAIRGHDGNVGLCSKLESINKTTDKLVIDVVENSRILRGDLTSPGLIEQVRQINQILIGYKYWIYLVVGAIVLNIIGLISTFVTVVR